MLVASMVSLGEGESLGRAEPGGEGVKEGVGVFAAPPGVGVAKGAVGVGEGVGAGAVAEGDTVPCRVSVALGEGVGASGVGVGVS